MSEALTRCRQNLKPAFDDQSAIYAGLMAEIDAAISFLDGGGLSGDFMFNGKCCKMETIW